MYYTNKLPT